jgi:23S rRNA (cytidine1920-2'-O)/16S rRNA (cytidine1409-2'-O)-methyltransferase
VSFISLEKILPVPMRLVKEGGLLICLVKPQFEVGRDRVGKGGVVRDGLAHRDAIASVTSAAHALGWNAQGIVGSPITGPAGNHEYLLWLSELEPQQISDEKVKQVIQETLRSES